MLLKGKAVSLVAILIALVILSCVLVVSVEPVEADAVQITDFSITTRDGFYEEGMPLVAGTNYQIQFIVDVAPGANDTIILETRLERQGDRYWTLDNNYPGVQSNWQPAQKTITFNSVPGTAAFTLSGYISEDATLTTLTELGLTEPGTVSITLHQPGGIELLKLSLQSGGELDTKSYEVVDNSIREYRDLLSDRRQMLDESNASSGYKDLVESIVDEAELKGEQGFTEEAIVLLKSIPSSGWPQSESGSSSLILIIVIAVVGIIAIVAGVLFVRSNSTVGFLKQRADDQARRLDIIESRIQKLGERSLAGEIAQIKDALRSMGR